MRKKLDPILRRCRESHCETVAPPVVGHPTDSQRLANGKLETGNSFGYRIYGITNLLQSTFAPAANLVGL